MPPCAVKRNHGLRECRAAFSQEVRMPDMQESEELREQRERLGEEVAKAVGLGPKNIMEVRKSKRPHHRKSKGARRKMGPSLG